jgi:hypothetical protein
MLDVLAVGVLWSDQRPFRGDLTAGDRKRDPHRAAPQDDRPKPPVRVGRQRHAAGQVLDGDGQTGQLGRDSADPPHPGRAWGQIVDPYCGVPWSVARNLRLSEHDAADVVQTVWLRLSENLGRMRDPDRLPGWLATTARREGLRLLRRREQPADVGSHDAASREPDPEQTAIERKSAGWSPRP